MNDDIVDRLRSYAGGGPYDCDGALIDEAADEIERLRSSLIQITRPRCTLSDARRIAKAALTKEG